MSEHNRNDCASCWAEGDVATFIEDVGFLCDMANGNYHHGTCTPHDALHEQCKYEKCVCPCHISDTPLADSIVADWYAGKLKHG